MSSPYGAALARQPHRDASLAMDAILIETATHNHPVSVAAVRPAVGPRQLA